MLPQVRLLQLRKAPAVRGQQRKLPVQGCMVHRGRLRPGDNQEAGIWIPWRSTIGQSAKRTPAGKAGNLAQPSSPLEARQFFSSSLADTATEGRSFGEDFFSVCLSNSPALEELGHHGPLGAGPRRRVLRLLFRVARDSCSQLVLLPLRLLGVSLSSPLCVAATTLQKPLPHNQQAGKSERSECQKL